MALDGCRIEGCSWTKTERVVNSGNMLHNTSNSKGWPLSGIPAVIMPFALTLTLLFAPAVTSLGQSLTGDEVWTYTLVDGSFLSEECLICGLPAIATPIRGTFDLQAREITPLFISYSIKDISFVSAATNGPQYHVTGAGIYQLGGEVAVQSQISLALDIDDGNTNQPAYFTNGPASPGRLWPMIQVIADQTNGLVARTYTLHLNAAPFQELWFSTQAGFHAGNPLPTTNYISPGDLVSSIGRVVRRNSELTAGLGVMPIVPDLGLDAVDILSGGEIAFAIGQDVFSETLGQLHQGDVLSDQGRIIAGYTNLLAAFGAGSSAADPGLDALNLQDDGEIRFSVKTNFFSSTLGITVGSGDWLSSLGQVIKTNAELIAKFNPADPSQDYGLDAVWVWPSGEIWFSTEKPFQDSQSTTYSPGDLLSDQGYVVYRNAELVAAFQPVENAADFGLNALYIVTDTTPPAPAPQITFLSPNFANGDCTLSWQGLGHVFQAQGAVNPQGPYLPRSPIMPDESFADPGVLNSQPQMFYRVRQW